MSVVGGFKLTKDPENALACIKGPADSSYAGGSSEYIFTFPLIFPSGL